MEELLKTEIIPNITGYNLAIIVHLFGLALGAGAAFYSDFLFGYIMKDKKISKTEFGILQLTSKVVWIGLSLLVLSGFVIFLGNTERLLDSAKFLSKMSIVFILVINGVIFHVKHIPMLKRFVGKKLNENAEFKAISRPFFVSGAVSGVSWAAALVLGATRLPDYSYLLIMSIYGVVVLGAAMLALVVHKVVLR